MDVDSQTLEAGMVVPGSMWLDEPCPTQKWGVSKGSVQNFECSQK